MNYNYYLFIYMFMVSCLLFSFVFKHLMLILIHLEFIMISVYYNMFMVLMMSGNDIMMSVMFLVISVCEGALSLSLIVMMVRFHGFDYLKSLNLLKW